MKSDTLTAGVKPGGLQSRTEIRVLICFILSNVSEPLDLENLKEKLHFEGIANYFETAFAVSELIESGNAIPCQGDDGKTYHFAGKDCQSIVDALGTSVPFSVRERGLEIANGIIERRRFERENSVEITEAENGFYVTCSVLEGGMELAVVKLLVPDKTAANAVKENFYKNPMETLIKATESLMNTVL